MINKLIIKVVAAFLVLNSFLIAQELSKEDKESLEILLLAKVVKAQNDNSILPLTVDINNNLSLSGRNKYISYNNCFTNDIEKSYSNVPTQLYKLLANFQDALAINSLYSNYQVKNLSTLVKVHVDEYFKNKNLVINEKCENNKPTNLNYTNSMNSDVLAIPRYLYAYLLQTQEFSTLNDTHVLFKTIKYDDLKNASDKVIEKKNKIENEYAKLVDNYNKNSNNDNKNFVGSLVISKDRYQNTMKVCTIDYKDIDAENVIGYRNLNEEFLTDYVKRKFKAPDVKIYQDRNLFEKTFKDLNEAYMYIKQYQYSCNVFIDYPHNLVKLKNALLRDKIETYYANIYDSNSMQEKYAKYLGYESKDELAFARKINASLKDVKYLRRYNANNLETYNQYLNEMIKENYSDKKDPLTVQWYIYDKENGKKENLSANEQRDKRIKAKKEAEEKAAIEQKKREEKFAKEYPYEAVLSCGFNNSHTNIAACFVAEKYGAETTLELSNGDFYNMYKSYNLRNAGKETREGLVIPLKNNFSIKAQNSNRTLVLNLRIVDKKTGRTIYQKSANKYGVVYFKK